MFENKTEEAVYDKMNKNNNDNLISPSKKP
jgi:hypothetical protein